MRKSHSNLRTKLARWIFRAHVFFFLLLWMAAFATFTSNSYFRYEPFAPLLVMWLPFFLGHVWWYQGGRRAAAPFESLAEFSQIEREAYREGYREGFRDATQREAPPTSLGRLAMSEDGELSDEWIDHVSGKIKRS